jgi:hypothetical protein
MAGQRKKKRMNDAWDVAQDGQNKIDPKVHREADHQKDSERWQKNGEDDGQQAGTAA